MHATVACVLLTAPSAFAQNGPWYPLQTMAPSALKYIQVLKSQSSDGEAVMGMLAKHSKEKHVYAKQMGKFVSTVQRRWLSEGVHFVRVQHLLVSLVPVIGLEHRSA